MRTALKQAETISVNDDPPSPPATESNVLDLEAAYRTYHGPLVSFLSNRLPEKSIAADIAQTVFTSLAARPPIHSIRDIRQYLFRAARNQLADYYRKHDVQQERAEHYAVDPVLAIGEDAPTPEEEAIRQDKMNRLRIIVDAMPKKRRMVFVMARFHELTETEIAARLGLNKAAVRQHVSRAMRDCQAEMKRIFDESPEGGNAGKLNGRATRKR